MKKIIYKHLAFISTMVITYVLGALFVIFQYINGKENLIEKMIDTLVPTTIAYILGCIIVNIIEGLKGHFEEYLFNISAFLCIIVYSIIFCMYINVGYSIGWGIAETILTIIMMILNIVCYREKLKPKKNNII